MNGSLVEEKGGKPCHTPPAFGCAGCIDADRRAFALKLWEVFKASFKPKKCSKCKRQMKVYDWWIQDGGKVMAEIICPNLDTSGHGEMLPCKDQDFSIDITNWRTP